MSDIWKYFKYPEIIVPVGLLLMFGLTMSGYFSYRASRWHRENVEIKEEAHGEELERKQLELGYRTRLRVEAIRSELERNFESLQGMSKLFTMHFSWHDFKELAHHVYKRHTDVEGVFWIPRLERNQLGEFKDYMENNAPPDYQLQDNGAQESEADEIWPIQYATPLKKNEKWLGHDARTHPVFAGIQEGQVRENETAATIVFSDKGADHYEDLNLVLDVTPEEPLKASEGVNMKIAGGYLVSLIHVPNLVDRALAAYDHERVNLYLFDEAGNLITTNGDKKNGEMKAPENLEQLLNEAPEEYVHRERVTKSNLDWAVVTLPPDGYSITPPEPSGLRYAGPGILFGGVFVTFLGAFYLFWLLKERFCRKQAVRRQRKLARTDGLTGLLNQRTFLDCAKEEFQVSVDRELPFCLLIVDLDHFKSVNDQYGHQTGDLVLQRVGDLLEEETGKNSIVGRYGGEEFGIAMPGAEIEDGRSKGEQIRKLFYEQQYSENTAESFRVTCSVGVAEREGYSSLDSLLRSADKALYEAKERGRNMVFVTGENPVEL